MLYFPPLFLHYAYPKTIEKTITEWSQSDSNTTNFSVGFESKTRIKEMTVYCFTKIKIDILIRDKSI